MAAAALENPGVEHEFEILHPGQQVCAAVVDAYPNLDATELGVVESAPLRDVVGYTLAVSENSLAEVLARTADDVGTTPRMLVRLRLPEPGSVEENVIRSYENNFLTLVTDEDHPCNWQSQLNRD